MWSLSDETLLAGLGSGDPESATAFIRRFQGRVFGLAYTILRDRAAAEEAAQEAFIRAWRHAGAYDPRRGGVATWLLTITRNVAVDVLRMRRPEPVDPEVLLAHDHGEEDQDRAALAADADRVRRAVANLPPEQRRAVVLAAMYAYTGREISESEGVPLGTVKTRIRTALLKLRAALSEVDDG